ncbi:MAG TPA: NADH-quinone oxidoreductase subunit L [Gemmataceae bacterium]|nr:NADH-quinone oxidoreductase subunit L [Gemmataceae bacterium]
MSDFGALLWLIPALPLLGAVLAALFGATRGLKDWAHAPVVLTAALSCACAIAVAARLAGSTDPVTFAKSSNPDDRLHWFSVDSGTARLAADFVLSADHLAGTMLLAVTFIGFWIVVFSVGYMKGSPGFARYFAIVSLFLASMTLLVLADNFLLLFAGWEGVGLCSYLLVGYWHHKPSASDAARKAFLVTRLGDVGLIVGMFLLWLMAGRESMDYDEIFSVAAQMLADHPVMFPAACLLVLCGAVGKSAQIPLYVWLPDAMEGPTPVSALIHAATMVTAGVYLLARCAPLFVVVPGVQLTVATIGAATALLAAFIALTQHDLKRVLAYSTVSQIGFMFLAVGCAGPAVPALAVTAAIFHLFTHAFFKAVLFLSSGSVMHAMHDVIDMREFGGLRKVLPVTHWTFLAGALALAGIPLFSGFWSKDMILEATLEAGHAARFGSAYLVLFGIALATALMTAFYTFRAYYRTFWGELRMPEGAHPHEPWVMTLPLIVLGVGAVFAGILAEPFTHWFSNFLTTSPHLVRVSSGQTMDHHLNWPLMLASSAAALIGVGIAHYLYKSRPGAAEKIAEAAPTPYYLSLNKLYVDEIYTLLFVQPLELLAGMCRLVEAVVYDLARLIAMVPYYAGRGFRWAQNGLVQFYALAMVLMVAGLLGYFVLFAK